MEKGLNPAYFLLLVPAIFGAAGGILAANRGRNPLLVLFWAVASALFPICIMIVYFKKPLREVEGKFRHCRTCGEWLPWKENPCRYCGTAKDEAA
jgi:predicted nucleic acid-binding Zn ribbon protein